MTELEGVSKGLTDTVYLQNVHKSGLWHKKSRLLNLLFFSVESLYRERDTRYIRDTLH